MAKNLGQEFLFGGKFGNLINGFLQIKTSFYLLCPSFGNIL